MLDRAVIYFGKYLSRPTISKNKYRKLLTFRNFRNKKIMGFQNLNLGNFDFFRHLHLRIYWANSAPQAKILMFFGAFTQISVESEHFFFRNDF